MLNFSYTYYLLVCMTKQIYKNMTRRLLRRFDTMDDYNDEKCSLEIYTISHIKEDKSTEYGVKKTYFTATYNVTSTSSSTKLLGNISQISKMYIDDIEVTPTSAYTFSTTRRT